MLNDFTRINFGWWGLFPDSQPNLFEYGNAKAAAFDAPVTLYTRLPNFYTALPELSVSPRVKDNNEVFRRWEYVRKNQLLTNEQKMALRDPAAEYTLLRTTDNRYELVRYYPLETHPDLIAYTFDYNEKQYVVYWHRTDEGCIHLPKTITDLLCETEPNGTVIPLTANESSWCLPTGDKRYVSTKEHKEALLKAFQEATV